MSDIYRLAVTLVDGAEAVVVEQRGRLLPLARLRGQQALSRLGGPPRDLAPLLADWTYWKGALAAGVAQASSAFEAEGVAVSAAHFRPPVANPPKLICIGSNYHDHIAEMEIPMLPTYPYAFLKPSSNTLRGSGEAVAIPAGVQMMDWEAELAVVIGIRARDVPAARALDIVAGYANFNDLSARDWLASRPPIGIDWVRHKAFDGFAPMGPYVVPAEFVGDPQHLPVKLSVNGTLKQDSNTERMVFGVAAIIEHLSSIMTLEPGDVIATGSPAGVGHGRSPQEYLRSGDKISIEIGALGELTTPIG